MSTESNVHGQDRNTEKGVLVIDTQYTPFKHKGHKGGCNSNNPRKEFP